MVCIYCSGKTAVTNSRQTKRLPGTWRRRACIECGSVITTLETIDYPTALSVKNSSGVLSSFVRDRLFLDVYDCLKHRGTAQRDATALTDSIIGKVLAQNKTAIVKRADLVEITVATLKRFDRAAAVQYKAYHPIKN